MPNKEENCIEKRLLQRASPAGFQVKPLKINNLDHSKIVHREDIAKIENIVNFFFTIKEIILN